MNNVLFRITIYTNLTYNKKPQSTACLVTQITGKSPAEGESAVLKTFLEFSGVEDERGKA